VSAWLERDEQWLCVVKIERGFHPRADRIPELHHTEPFIASNAAFPSKNLEENREVLSLRVRERGRTRSGRVAA
jgi:hypothetical protein